MAAIFRKELIDYFSSKRLIVIMLLAVASSALALYGAFHTLRGTLSDFAFLATFSSEVLPSAPADYASYLVYPNYFTYILMPLTGILLGFNAINKETPYLRRLVSQSIYRDSIINAKFLAGIFVIAVVVVISMLLVAGYGIRIIGVPPGSGEILRLFFFAFTAVIYGALWMAIAMLFSSIMSNRFISLIIPVAIWVFFGVYMFIIPNIVTSNAALALLRVSPMEWFTESSMILLVPQWSGMEIVYSGQQITRYLMYNPLSFGQSLVRSSPYILTLLFSSIVFFSINYFLFIRKDIRTF